MDAPERFKKLYEELRQRWNGLFGMVGSLAVFYGRSAAGDLFLPLVMDDYLQISMEHFSLLQSDPEFRSASVSILNERMAGSGTDLDTIRSEMKTLCEGMGNERAASPTQALSGSQCPNSKKRITRPARRAGTRHSCKNGDTPSTSS